MLRQIHRRLQRHVDRDRKTHIHTVRETDRQLLTANNATCLPTTLSHLLNSSDNAVSHLSLPLPISLSLYALSNSLSPPFFLLSLHPSHSFSHTLSFCSTSFQREKKNLKSPLKGLGTGTGVSTAVFDSTKKSINKKKDTTIKSKIFLLFPLCKK